MRVFKWLGYSVAILFIWIILLILTRLLAHEFLAFLASNVTNSTNCVIGPKTCEDFAWGIQFEWDNKLKLASYISYSIIFIVLIFITAIALKSKKSKRIKASLIIAFVLSFPTFTNWQVATQCFLGCTPDLYSYDIGVVVPLIMTADIFTIPSILIALGIIWLYIRISKVSI